MHKGKIDIIGTPNEIASSYGIGYRFCLENLKNGKEKTKILEIFKAIDSEIEVDDERFEKEGKLFIDILSKNKHKLSKIVRKMEQEGIKFKLIANSLEKAFVHLGEEKAQVDNISQIHNSTYSK